MRTDREIRQMPPKKSSSPDPRALQFELPFFSREETPRSAPPAPGLFQRLFHRQPEIQPTTPPAIPPAAPPVLRSPEPAAPPADGTKRRRIALEQRELDYVLRRSRRRSIGFVIDERGLTVSAPKWITIGQIEDAVREKQHWIFAKIAEMGERRALVPGVRWEDGGILPYLGATITMRIAHGSSARGETVRLDVERNELHIALPPSASAQQLKDRVQGWMQAEARRLFLERLQVYGERLGVHHRVLRLSSATTRWGSCSADGKILLNWRLVHFPMSSIDYVVAHELAHLKEMNHGPRFWQTVADLLPGFESARAHLKHPPPELLPKF